MAVQIPQSAGVNAVELYGEQDNAPSPRQHCGPRTAFHPEVYKDHNNVSTLFTDLTGRIV